MVCLAVLAMLLAGQQQSPPPQPPADSPPLVRTIEITFPNQGNVSVIDPATYLYYIETKPSRPSAGVWVKYDRQSVLDDFKRLWGTNFLDNLSIDVKDVPYENGVIGKHITYNLEERPRVKIVDYEGSKALETSKIDEALKEQNVTIRVDSFLDTGVVHKVERIVGDMLREKGYHYAKVSHSIKPMPGGPKLIHLTFNLDTGPVVRIRAINFVGNRVFSDGTLAKRMKTNKLRQWYLPTFLARSAAYQPAKFDEDADEVVQYYRDRGYVTARVGQPEMKALYDSRDHKTRWIELRVPVTEGKRYQVGKFAIAGNKVIKTKPLRELFKLRPGRFYREKAIRKGLEKARELYGSAGYFEFTGYPDLKPRDFDLNNPDAQPKEPATKGPGVLDVTMRLEEGKQYFVNQITFKGNTVTRDTVIRRELALAEGGVFNTEALKYSVKRLNQLGFFKPIEDAKGIQVEKAPSFDNRVDVGLTVEEQNRNQITFGAGVSEWDGVFGSASYTAANFLGRGESVTIAAQKGSRSNLYQVGFTEPYLFDRPLSAGVELYSRKYNYYTSYDKVGYSEVREGVSTSIGHPFRRFSRLSLNYTFEAVDVSISEDLLGAFGGSGLWGLPSFSSYYDKGRHIDSRITPIFMFNTVDNPMTPHSGVRFSASYQWASTWFGGTYDYAKPEGELIVYLPTSRKTGFGVRMEGGWLHPYGSTKTLPYYLRYFLGGEYQIRGTDIRSVGPIQSNRAMGGNKFVLFNAEYYIDIAGPVRGVLFHDAGQAFAENEVIDLRQLRTSSGAELRVLVPMLNVPFRLIWAWNFYRDSFQPERVFKFAVGTTF